MKKKPLRVSLDVREPSVVDHRDGGVVAGAPDLDADALTGGAVARGVRDEVVDDLAEPCRVGVDRDPADRADLGITADDRRDRSAEVDAFELEAQRAGVGDREVLEVLDEALEVEHLLVDRGDVRGVGRREAVLDRPELASQVGQRRLPGLRGRCRTARSR